ncbi:replication initiation protein [Escherichia coli]
MEKKTPAQHALENYKASDLERSSGERWVTMQNALIRAGQGLSLSEKRLVMLAVSTLDSRKSYRTSDIPTTRITAAEYAETYNVDINTAYDQLQSGAKQLYNRSITFFEPAYKRNGKPLKPIQVNMRWVGEAHYHKTEGWVELYWWPRLLPYLTGIRKQFTSYQLQQASALRSMYSWRLLELLLRFESTGVAEYTIEDFCASMDATEKQKANFNNIKRRIIEPAVKELNDKDGWVIDWEPIKAGRKVAKVRFTFKRDPQGRLL